MSTRETSSTKTSPDAGRPPLQRNEVPELDPLLDLQQSAGNQAMLRLLGTGTVQTKPNGSHGLMVQRAARDGAPAPDAAGKETKPALIVEDDAREVKPGQMRKTDFLSLLRTSVCATAEEALAGTMWSAMGCPYIERWLDHYSKQSSTHLERALRKYAAPEAASARSAQDYIPLVSQRLRRGIQEWKTTGEVSDLPEEFAQGGMPGATVSGLMGSLLSGVGSAISGVVSGAGKALSSVGSMLFKRDSGATANDPDDPQAIREELGDGHALDGGVKHRMQSALGADFSGVRVHSDSSAHAMSDRLNARAFTIGNDIAFGPGEYQPGTPVGDALIAHELAHVVQQQSADVAGAPMTKGAASGALEEEADISAVGAVVSLWGGAKGLFGNIRRNSLPRLRSGLKLQRCSSYSKSDLQKKIDKLPPVADLVAYINKLGGDDRKKAIDDLEKIRIDYVEREVSPDAVILMGKVLQEIYRGVAQKQAPAASAPEGGYAPGAAPPELLTGTRALSGAEKTSATSALTPVPSGGVLPPFKPTIPGKDPYETRIRDTIRATIDAQYAELVVGKGPAEHADPAKVFDMDRFKEIGNTAKAETDKVFGSYSKGAVFTSGTNLLDQFEDEESVNATLAASAAPGTDPLKDKAKGRVSYILNSDEDILKINREHGAVPTRTTPPAAGGDPEATILDRAREDFATSDGTRLLEIFRGWEGAQLEGKVYVNRFKKGSDLENRKFFWDTFQIMIHEYIHSLEHDDYHAYAVTFGEDSEQYNTLVEGMCSVVTEIAWSNIVPKVSTTALREKVETPAFAADPFDPSTVPEIFNRRYPSFDQAMKLVNLVGIRNVYAAFFLGKVELIGKP
jgi:hypothetical protein